jgi:hypothetical protein
MRFSIFKYKEIGPGTEVTGASSSGLVADLSDRPIDQLEVSYSHVPQLTHPIMTDNNSILNAKTDARGDSPRYVYEHVNAHARL